MPLPALAVLGVAGVAYKVFQSLVDEEWPGTEFPEEFRIAKIEDHWRMWGGHCGACARDNLRKSDLTVDHIVPIRRGGRNSRQNAQVMCLSCNSKKGDAVNLYDKFVGRGGRRPRRRA